MSKGTDANYHGSDEEGLKYLELFQNKLRREIEKEYPDKTEDEKEGILSGLINMFFTTSGTAWPQEESEQDSKAEKSEEDMKSGSDIGVEFRFAQKLKEIRNSPDIEKFACAAVSLSDKSRLQDVFF
jgi:hypothetical protein